jgi:microcystin-dependent protein
MTSNTLIDVGQSNGHARASSEHVNQYKTALVGDIVPRNNSGQPESNAGNLGTNNYPFNQLHVKTINVGGATLDSTAFGSSATAITSARTTGNSNKPDFLRAAGTDGFTLLATAKNFSFRANGVGADITADIDVANITTIGAGERTAQVDNDQLTGDVRSKLVGELDGFKINNTGGKVDGVRNQYVAFKHATTGEIIYGYHSYESDTQETIGAGMRGAFIDESGNPIKRQPITNGDSLELLSLGVVFIDADTKQIDVTYSEPTTSKDQPTSPQAGDYWYSLTTNKWNRWDGVEWQTTLNRLPIGLIVCDETGCIATHSFDLGNIYSADNSLVTYIADDKTIKTFKAQDAKLSIYGSSVQLNYQACFTWSILEDAENAISADLEAGLTLTANTQYYLYLKHDLTPIISDEAPRQRKDLKGDYHPYEAWRYIATYATDASSNWQEVGKVDKPAIVTNLDEILFSIDDLSIRNDQIGLFFGTNDTTDATSLFVRAGRCMADRGGNDIKLPTTMHKNLTSGGIGQNNGCLHGTFNTTGVQTAHVLICAKQDNYADIILVSNSQYLAIRQSSYNLPSKFVRYRKIGELLLNATTVDDVTTYTIHNATRHLLISDAQLEAVKHMTYQERQNGKFLSSEAFYGSSEFISSVYPNYAILDGSNYTQDLRNKFIVGQGSNYTSGGLYGDGIGATGGADSVALSTAQMPSHNHSDTFSIQSAGAHNHTFTTYGRTGNGQNNKVADSGGNATASMTTSSVNAHSHNINGSIQNTGSGQSHENRPPYYVHALITRIA